MSLALEFFGSGRKHSICATTNIRVPPRPFPALSACPTLRKEREGWGTCSKFVRMEEQITYWIGEG
jgi:hypothetical protein